MIITFPNIDISVMTVVIIGSIRISITVFNAITAIFTIIINIIVIYYYDPHPLLLLSLLVLP